MERTYTRLLALCNR